MKKLVYLFLFIFLSSLSTVQAHPGDTDSKGGHTCYTNCASYGLKYGEYHYSKGGGYSYPSSYNDDTKSIFKNKSAGHIILIVISYIFVIYLVIAMIAEFLKGFKKK